MVPERIKSDPFEPRQEDPKLTPPHQIFPQIKPTQKQKRQKLTNFSKKTKSQPYFPGKKIRK